MKLLLLFVAVLLFCAANAQKEPDNSPRQKFNFRFERPLVTIVPKDSSALKLYPYAQKAPGVYRLPQDGMPCIVPETKDLASIPNVWKGTLRGTYKGKKPSIPNPSVPPTEPETK